MANHVRYLIVRSTSPQIASYMPANYKVIGTFEGAYTLVVGHDEAGWTLDDYVIPRLMSGLYSSFEVTHDG